MGWVAVAPVGGDRDFSGWPCGRLPA